MTTVHLHDTANVPVISISSPTDEGIVSVRTTFPEYSGSFALSLGTLESFLKNDLTSLTLSDVNRALAARLAFDLDEDDKVVYCDLVYKGLDSTSIFTVAVEAQDYEDFRSVLTSIYLKEN